MNKERKQLYSQWTQGRSNNVYWSLLFMEKLTRILVRPIDKQAASFQAKGLSIGCAEFVSMQLTPVFKTEKSQVRPRRSDFVEMDHQVYVMGLLPLLRSDDFASIQNQALETLEVLAKEPKFNCLVRHFYESIARAAALAPIHEKRAKELGVPSTVDLSKKIIRIHMKGISWAHQIDQLAMPLQIDGFPIICQDLPAIPLPEEAN